jgi:hypothetical protein
MDHSRVHTKKPKNQLNANTMNVGPGGKQPYMRPGWFLIDGQQVEQPMVFTSGELSGKQKGLRAVAEERFGKPFVTGVCL